ncbi:MAG: DMT family transporter [Gaiella sp.]|nr:DMT family transporter [Gaiella sp.]
MGVAILALLGAVSWGVGDFFGGLAARRVHVLTVVVLSQAVGLAGAAAWVAASAEKSPDVVHLLPAAGAGACGAIGLAALYRGMAVGAMGVVAPISAASPVVPLTVDVVRGVSPSPYQWLGIAAALGGIVLLARDSEAGQAAKLASGVTLALVAALAFGLFVVGLDAAADESVPWTVLVARGTSTAFALVLAAAASVTIRPPARLLPAIVAVGLFDTTANVLVAFATTVGSAGVVAVLSALYPVATIVLARMILGERLDRTRRLGGALALGGAAVVAAG